MNPLNFDQVRDLLNARSAEERRKLFDFLREEFTLHPLEQKFGVRAEVICEAIARASDLTQRGIRGVIAEAVFVQQVLPRALAGSGWRDVADFSAADIPFDSLVEKGGKKVRIQVKNQRIEKGLPKQLNDCWVVEVQKTRSGEKNGEDTRPYRFSDFDLIAVCTWPSSKDWTQFTYALTSDLKARAGNSSLIEIMQRIPKDLNSGGWSTNLVAKLEEIGQAAQQQPGLF